MFPSTEDTFKASNCSSLSTTGICQYLSWGVLWTPSIPAGYTQCSNLFKGQLGVFCLRNAIGDLDDQIQHIQELVRYIPEVVGMPIMVLWNVIAKRNFVECIGTM